MSKQRKQHNEIVIRIYREANKTTSQSLENPSGRKALHFAEYVYVSIALVYIQNCSICIYVYAFCLISMPVFTLLFHNIYFLPILKLADMNFMCIHIIHIRTISIH